MEKLEILVPTDFNRFKAALDLQDGVNLRAIARTLVLAADAADKDGGGTAATYVDPAVVLIVNKLESLVRSEAIGTFSRAYAECLQKSKPKREPARYVRKPTREQLESLKTLYHRLNVTQRPSYREFRRSAQWEIAGDTLMVPYAGMWVGIETDGYTHS